MGKQWKQWQDFIFLGSKITADSDCSHEIKKHLLLGKKAMTNLDSILKSRDITLLTKVHWVKAIVFPLVMCGHESWTIKKAEHKRIDGFELWCWRSSWASLGLQGGPTSQSKRKSVLNIHWKTSNQMISILVSNMVSIWFPILWPPDAKNWLTGKDSDDAGKDWGQEEKGTTEDEMVGWHHQLAGHEFAQAPGGGDRQGSLACCGTWGCRVGHNWATEVTKF